jgi:hypothetical protein
LGWSQVSIFFIIHWGKIMYILYFMHTEVCRELKKDYENNIVQQ